MWEDNIKTDVKKIRYVGVDWISNYLIIGTSGGLL
jgi:hypothetical protein